MTEGMESREKVGGLPRRDPSERSGCTPKYVRLKETKNRGVDVVGVGHLGEEQS